MDITTAATLLVVLVICVSVAVFLIALVEFIPRIFRSWRRK